MKLGAAVWLHAFSWRGVDTVTFLMDMRLAGLHPGLSARNLTVSPTELSSNAIPCHLILWVKTTEEVASVLNRRLSPSPMTQWFLCTQACSHHTDMYLCTVRWENILLLFQKTAGFKFLSFGNRRFDILFQQFVSLRQQGGRPLWSSGHTSWLQTQKFRVRFLVLPDFLSTSGSGTGSTQPHEDK
jgi:hypothetical protein